MASKLMQCDDGVMLFHCPGCGIDHVAFVGIGNGPRWQFNENFDAPTFTPSILVKTGHYADGNTSKCWCTFKERTGYEPPFKCVICHSYVIDGKIQFLSDCTHDLAGQTVDLPDYEM